MGKNSEGGLTKEELEKLVVLFDPKKREKEIVKKRRYLEENAKDINQLVFQENFVVNEVLCTTYAKSITPFDGNTPLGGSSTSYPAGYSFLTELKVTPGKKDIPIRTLEFLGYSAVRAGECIWARIPRYVEESIESEKMHSVYDSGYETFYLNRDWREKEKAIEIIVLSENLQQLRIERGADFCYFFKC